MDENGEIPGTNRTHNSDSEISKAPLHSLRNSSEFKCRDSGSEVEIDEVRESRAKLKKRIKPFLDSDSESEKENVNIDTCSPVKDDIKRSCSRKSRIQNTEYSSSSDSDSSSSRSIKTTKNLGLQQRFKNKRNNLKQKFKNLLSSRDKNKGAIYELNKNGDKTNKLQNSDSSDESNSGSDVSNGEGSSFNAIKRKIKERRAQLKIICDPETSDEETQPHREAPHKTLPNQPRKSANLTSPKPILMSAKQAMENMQKIKSESNRMLREKEVSLPYHRPKALSLKDIMTRRKPALSSNGKSLPIKMNDEQLKQFALHLEQRQKEMMELCKSESEEEKSEGENKIEEASLITMPTDSTTDDLNNENIEKCDKITTELFSTELIVKNIDSTFLDIQNIANIKDTEKIEDLHNTSKDGDLNNETEEKNTSYTEFNLVYDVSLDPNTKTEKTNICNNVIENGDLEKNKSDCYMDADNNVSISKDKEFTRYNGDNLEQILDNSTTNENQSSSLLYNSEKADSGTTLLQLDSITANSNDGCDENYNVSDDDFNLDEIDKIIKNAEIIKGSGDTIHSPMLVQDSLAFKLKPKITGSPGMVIDLDSDNKLRTKKLTGVDLLKERYKYFAKLRTPEEIERQRELRIKPGAQLTKLKQELEEQLSEQRSLEWAKRLEAENKLKMEMCNVRGEASDEDDLDRIEAKLLENDVKRNRFKSECEEEQEIVEIEKPRKRNLLVEDEAEESDCEDDEAQDEYVEKNEVAVENRDDTVADNEAEDQQSTEEESSESDDELVEEKPKKGRILKAFEDSDDETIPTNTEDNLNVGTLEQNLDFEQNMEKNECNGQTISDASAVKYAENQSTVESQEEELNLAQLNKSISTDLFSQESALTLNKDIIEKDKKHDSPSQEEIGTQTFSILNSSTAFSKDKDDFDQLLPVPKTIPVMCEKQPYDDNLDYIVGMCSGSFSQNVISIEPPASQPSQSQELGEDVLALCTGKFYDNQFVSQSEDITQVCATGTNVDSHQNFATEQPHIGDDALKSILDELNNPEFETPKPKYFESNEEQNTMKRKFVIDSDDEAGENNLTNKKKYNKKRAEKRALQISDGEEEDEQSDEEDYISEIEEDIDRIVEYDSEENEVEIQPQKARQKGKMADFFEQEAELTSEDEWVGSGDEDEAGLDRMEREEGDDETFNQAALQNELGQIHIRDVLDQDKREVRLIQELLFEDGDLGEGHRQRKFRWKNADGEEETGTIPDEFTYTQEEEFESEEQWRKQRHEREVFLRQMQKEEIEDLNVTVSRTSIIKANLSSKTMTSVLLEADTFEKLETTAEQEKKKPSDVPSPKRAFAIYHRNYHGSLLSRGQGMLARLAALATPLAGDDEASKIGSLGPANKRNFVFTAIEEKVEEPKMSKRKAESHVGTPRLIKKIKTDEKPKFPRNSLLDHLKI